MSNHYLDWSPDQPHLLPASPQEWLPAGHLAYQVCDVVEMLNLSAFEAAKGSETRGAPGFPPRMMVTLLIYAWSNHIYSSRRMARMCLEDLGGRYLAGGLSPDFRVFSRFQRQYGEQLADIFTQSVRLCERAGMVSLAQ